MPAGPPCYIACRKATILSKRSPTITAEDATRLRVAIGVLARSLRPTAAGAGLTPSELTTLAAIVRTGPIGLSALADRERLNPTMLSRITARLGDAGLIARSTAPDERRAARVEATAAGRERHASIQAERTRSLARHLDDLDPAQAAALLEALPALEALGAAAGRDPTA